MKPTLTFLLAALVSFLVWWLCLNVLARSGVEALRTIALWLSPITIFGWLSYAAGVFVFYLIILRFIG